MLAPILPSHKLRSLSASKVITKLVWFVYNFITDREKKEQKAKLLSVLKSNEPLFQGKHGNWKEQPVSIEVINGAKQVWSKPYPIPLMNREIFNEEIDRRFNIQVLREFTANKTEDWEWASPCFGVPKKDGSIHFVMDFLKLNMLGKEYPLQPLTKSFRTFKALSLHLSLISTWVISPSRSPRKPRGCWRLSPHSVSSNHVFFQWASNQPQTSSNQEWSEYFWTWEWIDSIPSLTSFSMEKE